MSPLLEEANRKLNEPTWGNLSITIPVIMMSCFLIGYTTIKYFTGA